jgi:lipopolysaccharide transport system ATP-binding protein
MSTVIKVENLSKRYRLGVINRDMLYKDLQSRWARFRGKEDPNAPIGAKHDKRLEHGDEFWALRNVDLEVKEGEILGIIGRNGAGKSTLLKILSQITAPTEGRIKVKGRIASLLEVGTGFHPELTGRENVYLNGAILGMTRKEVRSKFDEIVAFAEIDEFIDTPVKRYSSGMYVRLAFAVAAHLEPEILIVDEVLAVGDATFQQKCMSKMRNVSKDSGKTIIFVSHNMPAIKNLCCNSICLQDGSVAYRGKTDNAVSAYLELSQQTVHSPLAERRDRSGSGVIKFTKVSLINGENREVKDIASGESITLRLLTSNSRLHKTQNFAIAMGINDASDQRICHFSSATLGITLQTANTEQYTDVVIHSFPLVPGNYSITLFAEDNGEVLDWISHAYEFTVHPGDFFHTGKIPPENQGLVYVPYYMKTH